MLYRNKTIYVSNTFQSILNKMFLILIIVVQICISF